MPEAEENLDRLRCLEIFCEVARTESFTKAATSLGVSKGSITKHITSLEDSLRVRLFNRTTTQVILTDAGASVLEKASALLIDYEEMESDVRASIDGPRGAIRIGSPTVFARNYLLPIIARFTEQHPDISFCIIDNVQTENFLTQRLDISLQMAPNLKDSSFIGYLLAEIRQTLVASPAYIARHGKPEHPNQLTDHSCLVHTFKNETSVWRFNGPDGQMGIKVHGNISSNSSIVLIKAALNGEGVGLHPRYMLNEFIEKGQLIPLIEEYPTEKFEIHIIYPTKQKMPKRVKLFINFLKQEAKRLRAEMAGI